MQELAKSQSDVNQVTAYIEELKEAFHTARKNLEIRSDEGVSSDELHRFIDYLDGIEQRRFEAEEVLEKLKVIVEKRRAALHQKSVERKAITNLKEKRKQEYVEEAMKAAQNESDEMVLLTGMAGKSQGSDN